MSIAKKIAIALSVIVLVGCAPSPHSGVVGWGKGAFSTGSFAPDIPYTAADGRKTTLHKVRHSVTLLAFTSAPAEMCCWVNPKLVNLASKFRDLPISVVQISLPTGNCPHGQGCAEACNLNKAHLLSLCDKDRIAWNSYGQPKDGTVFLMDEKSEIVSIGSMANLKSIATTAWKMGQIRSPNPRKGPPYRSKPS